MRSQHAVKIKVRSPNMANPWTNLNLPNLLTLSRIFLIPVFVFLFSTPSPIRSMSAAAVFVLAALTDALDGYVARRRGQITNLGKLLDPVADKLLVAAGLIMLVQFQRVSVWLVIVIIAREIIVTGARAVAAKEGFVLPADTLGKYKVILQISGILLLLLEEAFHPGFQPLLHLTGTLVLYVSLLLALVSGGRYILTILRRIGPQYI